MESVTANTIAELLIKAFYILCFVFLLNARDSLAQVTKSDLYQHRLKSLDIENSFSGLVAIYNGHLKKSIDGQSITLKKSNNVYSWDGSSSICFFSENSSLPYGIYLNRRQEKIAHGLPANANVDINLGDIDGFIRTELIWHTNKNFKGSNRFEIIFSAQPSLQKLGTQLFEAGVSSSQILDPVTEIYALRDAVTHDFFGHPLLHRFHERTDGWGQIIGGVIIAPLAPPKTDITRAVFSIPKDFLDHAFKAGLKTTGKLPAEFRPLVRDLAKAKPFARDAWVELHDVIGLLNGDSDEELDGYAKAREFISNLNTEIDNLFSSGSTVLLDPLLRGSYLENQSWLDDKRHDLIARTIAFPKVFSNSELSFALASMVYSLGIGNSGACYFEIHRFANGELKPEIRAAMAAHWHLPVKESEIEAVVEILKTALLPSVRSEAIDVLVLLGQIDKVPANLMAAWTDDNLFKAEPKLLRRKLAYLMKTKSGRDYLRGQLTSPAMSAETKDVVKAVITKHVEATKKLKRFDMISEDEVSDLEAAINSQLSVDS
jgi:hypothetical protein